MEETSVSEMRIIWRWGLDVADAFDEECARQLLGHIEAVLQPALLVHGHFVLDGMHPDVIVVDAGLQLCTQRLNIQRAVKSARRVRFYFGSNAKSAVLLVRLQPRRFLQLVP